MKNKDLSNFVSEASYNNIKKMSIYLNRHDYNELIDDINNNLERSSVMSVKYKAIEDGGFNYSYGGMLLSINKIEQEINKAKGK